MHKPYFARVLLFTAEMVNDERNAALLGRLGRAITQRAEALQRTRTGLLELIGEQ